MTQSSAESLDRIDVILGQYDLLRSRANYDDLSGGVVSDIERFDLISRAQSAILAIAPSDSSFARQLTQSNGRLSNHCNHVVGLLRGLRADVDAGFLWKLTERIHGEVFSDFIEMAASLLKDGYKDPAAVIVGGVLEEHLRKLCIKNNLPIADGPDFKKASTMNDELKKASVYGALDHKSVLAWLDLRNKAAHGRYGEFNPQQVENMLSGVREFLVRNQA